MDVCKKHNWKNTPIKTFLLDSKALTPLASKIDKRVFKSACNHQNQAIMTYWMANLLVAQLTWPVRIATLSPGI
jgi:hypothetical protein